MKEQTPTQRRFPSLLLIIVMFAALVFVTTNQRRQEQAVQAFGQPLFSHALPAGAALIQTDARRDNSGVVSAAMIIRSPDSQEELLAFFSDMDYPPFAEGEETRLQVQPLDDASLETLRRADVYEEGAQYWFIYLTSQPADGG